MGHSRERSLSLETERVMVTFCIHIIQTDKTTDRLAEEMKSHVSVLLIQGQQTCKQHRSHTAGGQNRKMKKKAGIGERQVDSSCCCTRYFK